jgi:hypothetical protein
MCKKPEGKAAFRAHKTWAGDRLQGLKGPLSAQRFCHFSSIFSGKYFSSMVSVLTVICVNYNADRTKLYLNMLARARLTLELIWDSPPREPSLSPEPERHRKKESGK